MTRPHTQRKAQASGKKGTGKDSARTQPMMVRETEQLGQRETRKSVHMQKGDSKIIPPYLLGIASTTK
jgi:hypothetical protein